MKVKKQLNLMQLITMALILVIVMQMTTQHVLNANGKVNQTQLLEHKLYSIETRVFESFAETNVTHVFNNPTDIADEVLFFVTIPNGAYLSNASVTISGQTFWGQVFEKQEAQQSYENATEAGRSAVLINEYSTNKYSVDVNVANYSVVSISIFYVQRLLRVLSSYDLTTFFDNTNNPVEIVHKIEIFSPKRTINYIQAPKNYVVKNISLHQIEISYTNKFQLPGIDNKISYSLNGEGFGSNVFSYSNGTNDFFVATFSPVLESLGTSQIGKDFVFLIDASGSMSGVSGSSTKMGEAKSALNEIISDLYIEDRFGVISFSSQTESLSSNLVDRADGSKTANVMVSVSNLNFGGSTNIYQALIDGLDLFEDNSRPKIMVLLTDGRPSTGIVDITQIISGFTSANIELGVSLFSLGFGNDLDFNFLQSLSRENNGDALSISTESDAVNQITEFYSMIEAPILVDLSVTVKSGVEGNLYPYFLPNLYQGSELFLVGKKNGSLLIEINGTTSESDETWLIIDNFASSIAIEDQWVEQIYVITVIHDLLTQITYLSEDTSVLKSQVLELALTYGIVTPYTSIFIDTKDLETNQGTEIPDEGLLPGQGVGSSPTWHTNPDTYHTSITEAYAATSSFELTFSLLAILSLSLFSVKKKKFR